MIKRIVLLVFILISIPNISVANQENINIDQAVNIALEENLDLKVARLNLKNAKLGYKREKLEKSLASSEYLKLQNKLNLAQAKEKYQRIRNELAIEITELYLNTLLAKEKIEVRNKEVRHKELNLFEVEQEVDSGYKNELDFYEAKIENNEAKFILQEQKIDAGQLLEELKLNLDLEIDLELLEVDYSNLWQIELRELLNKAKSNNLQLSLKKKRRNLALLEIKRAKVDSTSNLDLEKLENQEQIAKYNYQNFISSLENSVQREYYNLQSAIEELKIIEDKIEQFERRYKVAQEQRERNLISQADMSEIESEFLQAKASKLSAITNYYISKLKLQNLIGLEIEVSADGEF